MPPIKVAFLIASFRTGGKEKLTAAVLQGLDRQRFDPFLCVMKDGDLLAQVASQRVYARLWRFRGDILGFAWRLGRVLRSERPQILVCLSYRIVGVVGRVLARILGIPVVIYELHGVEQAGAKHLDPLDRWLTRHLTDHMLTLGETFRQQLIAEGVPPAKLSVIPNGVDTALYAPRPALSGQFRRHRGEKIIGCLSNMRPVKNTPLLLAVFAQVLKDVPEARLVIVGEGVDRPRAEQETARLGLSEKVDFLGFRRDIPDVLNGFDVLALTSLSEALPLALMEGMACGLPVVATRVGDVPALVRDGETGYLLEAGDAVGIAAALTRLLQDEALRQRMGQVARQHIEAHFSLTACIRQREQLFSELLRSVTQPSPSKEESHAAS
jgi:glycosyltransferase involved in cell wall biosynthesis